MWHATEQSGGNATERLRKDPIATVAADNVPLATVVAEVDMECGKVVDGNIADYRTGSDTTTGYPGRPGSAGERMAGGRGVGS
jgi:hypothetical protein